MSYRLFHYEHHVLILIYYVFHFSSIKIKFAWISRLKDGILWRICHATCRFVYTITTLQVRFSKYLVLIAHQTHINLLHFRSQSVSTRQYSTTYRRTCWIFAKCAAAHNVHTVPFTMQLCVHRCPSCYLLRQALSSPYDTSDQRELTPAYGYSSSYEHKMRRSWITTSNIHKQFIE